MTPDYFICDKCKEGKVETKNRVRLFDGRNDLGASVFTIVDLCPGCMASLVLFGVSIDEYRMWRDTNEG